MPKAIASESNKRIAKNSLFLYFRLLLTMCVSLYTVRVVLKTLGVVDYGIYNVAGSIVTMFSFLSVAMSAASQRFFAFELGRENYDQLKKIFSMTMTIYFLLALFILILAETVGLWFFNSKLTIPADRMAAAQWVYQFSILSFMMTMITVPYNAVIIVHEKMKVYAYVSIIEVILKLGIVYLLVWFSFDKLKLYSVLTFGVVTTVTFIYRTYCQKRFAECRFSFHWDKALFQQLIGYSGWNLFGTLSSILRDQGLNILLNIFFGPAVNAARGIAYQAQSVLLNFGQSFYTAVRPQITKSYAANRLDETNRLVFQSTKFSFYLLLFLSLPLILQTKFFLGLWLKDVPQYAIVFVQLVVIDTLLRLLVNPLVTLAQASGKIKWYQIVVGSTGLLTVPVAYLVLSLEANPQYIFYVSIVNTIIVNSLRLVMLKRMINFDVASYSKQVTVTIAVVCFFSFIVPIGIQNYWAGESMIKSIAIILLAWANTAVIVLIFGLKGDERKFLYNMLMTKMKLKPAIN